MGTLHDKLRKKEVLGNRKKRKAGKEGLGRVKQSNGQNNAARQLVLRKGRKGFEPAWRNATS